MEEPHEDWPFYDQLLAEASPEERCPSAGDEDLVVIMFTAGTTGTPKGVMLTHDSFSSYILTNVEPADPVSEEKNVLTVPMYHIAGPSSGDGCHLRGAHTHRAAPVRAQGVDDAGAGGAGRPRHVGAHDAQAGNGPSRFPMPPTSPASR